MSFSDDGWGSDSDDVKVAEPQKDVLKIEVAPTPPVRAQSPPVEPQAAEKVDLVEEPIGNVNNQVVMPKQSEKFDITDDEIVLSYESDDGWGKDTPVKATETVTKAEPKTGVRPLVLPPAVKVPELMVDSNTTYDETLDFSQPPEMTSPHDIAPRKFVLPPKVLKELDEADVKLPVGPPSLKPAGFGGDSVRVPLAEIGTEFSTKPTFGRQLPAPTTLNSTLKTPGFGTTGDKPSGFGSSDKPEVEFGEKSQKPAGFGEFINTAQKPSGFGLQKSSGFGKQEDSAKSINTNTFANKQSGFGGGFSGAPRKPTGFTEGTAGFAGGWNAPGAKSGFGQTEAKTSGFGSEKSSGEWETTCSSKSTRFNQAEAKPSGFGGPKSTSGFGETETKGFGQTSAKAFENEKSTGGWRKTNSKPAFEEQKSTSGFNQSETKPSGFGQSSVKSFGSEKPASGWGDTDSKPSGFAGPNSASGFRQSEIKPSGFGQSSVKSGFGSEKSAEGWSSNGSKPNGQAETKSAGGFGQSTKSGFGSEKSNDSKPSGFGSSGPSKGTGFGGDGGKSNGWGQNDSKPSGFVSKGGFSKSSGFNSEDQSGGFGSSDTKPSDFGSSKTSSKLSGFGGSEKADSFGASKQKDPVGFGGNASSGGFGESKQSSKPNQGFGADSKHSGFGSSGGFGRSSGSGFGDSQKPSAFGGSGTSGFGNSSGGRFGENTKSGGFGASGGFASGGGGFGAGGDTGFGNAGKSSGYEGGDRKFACFNCGSEDHRKDECPEPPKPRTCRNCGQEGHFSRECENERVVTGACRNCGEEGHFSRDCREPKVPHGPCRNCQQEGHFYKDCTNERVHVEPTEPCRRCGDEGHWAFDCPSLPRDLAGNVLVPYDVQFVPEAEMFNDAVNNDDRIDFDQKVFASIGNANVPDYASFDEFKMLAQGLTNNLKRMKMNRPTPIQRAAFFPVLNGNDVVACAHTGSGKTLAFLIPFATKLIDDMVNHDGVRDDKPSPGLLIVSPTRELASQTFNTARQLTYETGLKCGIAYGGYSRNTNLQHLRSFDQLNILVATMGRLQDFLESKDISLDKLKYVVLDEADRMVDSNDFGQEVANVIGSPHERTAQTVLFSASFSESLQREDLPKFVKEGYTMLQVDKFGTANEKIEQTILSVPRSEKRSQLCKVLGLDENTCSLLEGARVLNEKTLIFVNSVKFTDSLASFLCNSGITTIGMHSHQNQEIRDRILEEFRRGKYMCMVASNVAARGLNISGLDHVINYDMPDLKGFDEYVNRIGRTGRAGFTGAATAFVDEDTDREIIPSLVNILEEAKKEVPEWLTNINEQNEHYNNEEGEDGW